MKRTPHTEGPPRRARRATTRLSRSRWPWPRWPSIRRRSMLSSRRSWRAGAPPSSGGRATRGGEPGRRRWRCRREPAGDGAGTRRNGYPNGNGLFSPRAANRYSRAQYPAAASDLHAGGARGRPRVRGGPPRERLPAGRRSRGAPGPGVSLLRLVDQEADALRARKSEEDVRGGRHSAEPRREGAGVSHRPRALQRVRRGLAGVLPAAAAADDGRHERAPGPRLARRGRPDGHDADGGGSRRAVERPAATGELLRGGGGGRSRVRGGAGPPRRLKGRPPGRARRGPGFRLWVGG